MLDPALAVRQVAGPFQPRLDRVRLTGERPPGRPADPARRHRLDRFGLGQLFRLDRLQGDEQVRLREADLWIFQKNEIESAALREKEDEELEAERRVLANAEKLLAASLSAYELLYESDRRINVEWSRVGYDANGRTQRYPVKITVYCDDRTGMLKELTAVISDDNTNIRGVDINHDDNGEAVIEFVVEAEDLRHLNRMVLGLRRVQGVRTVQRTQKL